MIKQIPIWSKKIRIIHGFFLLSFILLITTGWLLNASINKDMPLVIHQIASSFFGFFLLVRLILLVTGGNAERLKSFFNQGEKLKQINALLAFYFSLGKYPLPNWHSKSVVWSLLYLVMFVLMALALITGVLNNYQDMWLGFILQDLHSQITTVLLWLVVLHVLTAILHDVKSPNGNISAMLSGNRYFFIEDKKTQDVTVKFK